MTIGERIRSLRTKYALSQRRLSELLNVSDAAVTKWETGKTNPSIEQLYKLSQEFGVTADYLLGIDDNSQPEQSSKLLKMYDSLDNETQDLIFNLISLFYDKKLKEAKNKQPLDNVLSNPPTRYIQHFLLKPSAGSSFVLDDYGSEMIPLEEGVPAEADFCLTISGRSMEPYVKDNELVYVHKLTDIQTGDIGIFSVDGAMVCKLFIKNNDGSVILASTNPDYASTNIILSPEASNSVICYGKVLNKKKLKTPDYLFKKVR